MVETYRPSTLTEALEIRKTKGANPFAGGTDLMVRYRAKNGMPSEVPGPVLYLDGLKELRGVLLTDEYLEIGASLPLAVVADDPGERAGFSPADTAALESIPELLQASAAELGAPALRQRATIAGNIANASPAGDTVAALYALDAEVVLAKVGSERTISVVDFILGPGETALEEDELIRSVRIPTPLPTWGYWRKVGTRRANALTKVSLAAAFWIEAGSIKRCSMAFGAVGPTIVRAPVAEALLRNKSASDLEGSVGSDLISAVADNTAPAITPIDDQRSTARYRKTVALNLIGEVITSVAAHLKENKS